MTEFLEAVAYAIYCVGLEGLNTSLKTEEALIYVYDGPIAGFSSQVQLEAPYTSHSLYTFIIKLRDRTAVIEVDESLFWLQTSMKAFWNNAIESYADVRR